MSGYIIEQQLWFTTLAYTVAGTFGDNVTRQEGTCQHGGHARIAPQHLRIPAGGPERHKFGEESVMSLHEREPEDLPCTSQALAELWGEEALCDVVLESFEGVRTKAHKIILAASSTYFRALFAGAGRNMLNCNLVDETGLPVIKLDQVLIPYFLDLNSLHPSSLVT